MANQLTIGTPRVGHLIPISDDAPFQAAVVELDTEHRVRVTVPFVAQHSQFAETEKWFGMAGTPPSTIVLGDEQGFLTLNGLRWSSLRGSGLETGQLVADTVIVGRPRHRLDVYRVRETMSNLDGLTEWAPFGAVNVQDQPRGVTVSVGGDDDQTIRFRGNGFSFDIRENSPWHATYGVAFSARAEAALVSRRSKGATTREHLAAQHPIRALLALLNGKPIRWRRHRVRDDEFPTWMLAGPPLEPSWLDARLDGTAFDHRQPEVASADYMTPLASLRSLGSAGLTRWIRLYTDDAFRRAVEPAVEVVNHAARFLEPQVMMLAMSLDAMGYWRDPARRRGTAMWNQIARCLHDAGLDVADIGSIEGVSRLISNTNNDLKHPDRQANPTGIQLRLVKDLALALFRSQLHDRFDLDKSSRDRFRQNLDLTNALSSFDRNGFRVSDDGSLLSTTP